jgi:hypothetical protein
MATARLALHLLGLAVLLWSAPTSAATVAVVRPTSAPALMSETVGRLRGELASAGFTVEIVDEPTTDATESRNAPRVWLERLANRRSVDAVVAILGHVAPNSVEVWVVAKVTKKSVVRSIALSEAVEGVPKTLAIRAMELLRSSFLELDLAANDNRKQVGLAPAPPVVQFLEKERLANRGERFALELGGHAVMSLEGVGPALLPSVRFDWVLLASLTAQLTLAGLGTHPTVANRDGSAEVAQAYGLLGVSLDLRTSGDLRPFLALSAGVLHTSAEGRTASSANQENQPDQWSVLFDGGAGTRLRLRDRLFLSLDFHAQMAQPRVAIRLVDDVVAHSAGPNLLVSVAVGAWL